MATTVVPALDVVENDGAGFVASRVTPVHTFGFKGGQETFHDGIVVAVATSAHAHLDVSFRQRLLVIMADMLTNRGQSDTASQFAVSAAPMPYGLLPLASSAPFITVRYILASSLLCASRIPRKSGRCC
jgi:hypothetical protein